MRQYQSGIINVLENKENWGGNNTVVSTKNNVTEVFYYGNRIAVIDHNTKSATLDNCGYNNASTLARINAVKQFCEENNYTY